MASWTGIEVATYARHPREDVARVGRVGKDVTRMLYEKTAAVEFQLGYRPRATPSSRPDAYRTQSWLWSTGDGRRPSSTVDSIRPRLPSTEAIVGLFCLHMGTVSNIAGLNLPSRIHVRPTKIYCRRAWLTIFNDQRHAILSPELCGKLKSESHKQQEGLAVASIEQDVV